MAASVTRSVYFVYFWIILTAVCGITIPANAETNVKSYSTQLENIADKLKETETSMNNVAFNKQDIFTKPTLIPVVAPKTDSSFNIVLSYAEECASKYSKFKIQSKANEPLLSLSTEFVTPTPQIPPSMKESTKSLAADENVLNPHKEFTPMLPDSSPPVKLSSVGPLEHIQPLPLPVVFSAPLKVCSTVTSIDSSVLKFNESLDTIKTASTFIPCCELTYAPSETNPSSMYSPILCPASLNTSKSAFETELPKQIFSPTVPFDPSLQTTSSFTTIDELPNIICILPTQSTPPLPMSVTSPVVEQCCSLSSAASSIASLNAIASPSSSYKPELFVPSPNTLPTTSVPLSVPQKIPAVGLTVPSNSIPCYQYSSLIIPSNECCPSTSEPSSTHYCPEASKPPSTPVVILQHSFYNGLSIQPALLNTMLSSSSIYRNCYTLKPLPISYTNTLSSLNTLPVTNVACQSAPMISEYDCTSLPISNPVPLLDENTFVSNPYTSETCTITSSNGISTSSPYVNNVPLLSPEIPLPTSTVFPLYNDFYLLESDYKSCKRSPNVFETSPDSSSRSYIESSNPLISPATTSSVSHPTLPTASNDTASSIKDTIVSSGSNNELDMFNMISQAENVND